MATRALADLGYRSFGWTVVGDPRPSSDARFPSGPFLLWGACLGGRRRLPGLRKLAGWLDLGRGRGDRGERSVHGAPGTSSPGLRPKKLGVRCDVTYPARLRGGPPPGL